MVKYIHLFETSNFQTSHSLYSDDNKDDWLIQGLMSRAPSQGVCRANTEDV